MEEALRIALNLEALDHSCDAKIVATSEKPGKRDRFVKAATQVEQQTARQSVSDDTIKQLQVSIKTVLLANCSDSTRCYRTQTETVAFCWTVRRTRAVGHRCTPFQRGSNSRHEGKGRRCTHSGRLGWFRTYEGRVFAESSHERVGSLS